MPVPQEVGASEWDGEGERTWAQIPADLDLNPGSAIYLLCDFGPVI